MTAFGEPLRPVLMRRVRRDEENAQTFFHVRIVVAGHEFGLDMVMSDEELRESEGDLIDFKAEGMGIQIGSLLKPWLADMIKKNMP